jgi:Uma2 family endonuclease
MATAVKRIGPADHGRPMAYADYLAGDYEEGYQYELIDGKLYVSPHPDPPENRVEEWIGGKLFLYSLQHPEIINYVSAKARVVVPDRPGVTTPEPDRAAYHDYPLDLPFEELDWQNLHPVLVVEVLSADNPAKDLVRNVELYEQVPSIREYWVFDTRASAEQPSLTVYRRRGRRWQRPIELAFRQTYTTRLLPGFELVLDPRK